MSRLPLTLRTLGRTGNLANAMDPGTKLSGRLKWVESWDFLYGNSWRSCSGVICGNGWVCGKIKGVLDDADTYIRKKKLEKRVPTKWQYELYNGQEKKEMSYPVVWAIVYWCLYLPTWLLTNIQVCVVIIHLNIFTFFKASNPSSFVHNYVKSNYTFMAIYPLSMGNNPFSYLILHRISITYQLFIYFFK